MHKCGSCCSISLGQRSRAQSASESGQLLHRPHSIGHELMWGDARGAYGLWSSGDASNHLAKN
jgi:hypothetical protein